MTADSHTLHPLIEQAATGRLPAWAEVGPARLRHVEAVAALMDRWARELGLPDADRHRWLAAAHLHDALRDADPASLAEAADYAPRLRHGPAAAARLSDAGLDDAELLDAIRYHTLGWSGWRDLGRSLYLADYLEPGRGFQPARRAALRARLPGARSEVLREVCTCRVVEGLRRGRALRPETVDFWNSLRGST